MWTQILVAIGILTGLGLTFACILALAYKKLKVYEDPRLDQLEAMLPGTNCGACGQPGCRAFAEKLIASEKLPGKCTVSSANQIETVAQFLGVEAGKIEKRTARLLCAGGYAETWNTGVYQGTQTCRNVSIVTGGNKGCVWGCLGLGDCETVCSFDAIAMNTNGLPLVDVNRCTACGDCVEICPKHLFTIMPLSHKLIVQCRSRLEGESAERWCRVACNACERCVADALPGLMSMKDNLPVIDYTQNTLASPTVTKRCPTQAICWVEGTQFQEKKLSPVALKPTLSFVNERRESYDAH